jgi:hypothetical protein
VPAELVQQQRVYDKRRFGIEQRPVVSAVLARTLSEAAVARRQRELPARRRDAPIGLTILPGSRKTRTARRQATAGSVGRLTR